MNEHKFESHYVLLTRQLRPYAGVNNIASCGW